MKERKEKSLKRDGNSFSFLLKRVKNDDLREFVKEFGQTDKEFKAAFFLRFLNQLEVNGKERFESVIKNIIGEYDSDYIYDYDVVERISFQLSTLLQEAKAQLAQKNYIDPFYLVTSIITGIHPVFECEVDAFPMVRDTMTESFHVLEDILYSDAGFDLKSEIFEFALKEIENTIYEHFGFENYMLDLLLSSATDDEKRDAALNFIDKRITKIFRDHSFVSQRAEENLLLVKMNFLKSIGRTEESRRVLVKNLHITSFRKQVIEEAIEKGEFSYAKEIIKDCKLDDLQKGRLHESSFWDEYLLQIAQKENDVRSVRHFAFQLFKDAFDLKYYRVIKGTYNNIEWLSESERIIATIKTNVRHEWSRIEILAELYKEEARWSDLLVIMRKNAYLDFLDKYYDVMKEKYPAELLEIYQKAIRRYAEDKMGASHYSYVTHTLRKIQSLPEGKEMAKALAIELKVQYRQRRNMVKELNKLVF